MHIDEEKELLNISDHCLVRTWFKIGNEKKTRWNKPKKKETIWIKQDEESLKEFVKNFKPKIGKRIGFKKFMGKMKTTLNATLKKKKKAKHGNERKYHHVSS